ncbi:putative Transcriptional factor TINY [Hibiscus syriacus]|uniref:Transcriptional factor TINY n=1 Tax=Hibiscus syriacus TaxID=106335 RepID=A0A6A2YRZ1_HIBSY|nr:putative Transcriptional factor TINY [Hibiscus syriacus]
MGIFPRGNVSTTILSRFAMATAFHHHYNFTPTPVLRRCRNPPSPPPIILSPDDPLSTTYSLSIKQCSGSSRITCKATEMPPVREQSAASGGVSGGENWVPVVPLAALPKGERRVIIQDGDNILLLWYKDEVFAIENRSPLKALTLRACSTPSLPSMAHIAIGEQMLEYSERNERDDQYLYIRKVSL